MRNPIKIEFRNMNIKFAALICFFAFLFSCHSENNPASVPGTSATGESLAPPLIRNKSEELGRDNYTSGQTTLLKGPDGVTVTGLFFMPEGSGPFPGVVVVPNPDGGNIDLCKRTGDEFAKNGIAAITFYPRGFSPSLGERLSHSIDMYRSDAIACLEALLKDSKINGDRIGFFGTGGPQADLALLSAASSRSTDFVVLHSYDTRPVRDKMLDEEKDDLKKQVLQFQLQYIDKVIDFGQLQKAQERARSLADSSMRFVYSEQDPYLNFLESRYRMEPGNWIAKLTCPSYCIYGSEDETRLSSASKTFAVLKASGFHFSTEEVQGNLNISQDGQPNPLLMAKVIAWIKSLNETMMEPYMAARQ
jgi:dienelactone hydrolase